ncbi:MAG: hypothetical protein G3M78_09350 [Candidatus Nitrohelix vancouverensis]|uniref:Uncharacterized protein n=1 Tax=Candidatus Nitrohelix vancouverensis TaxID=2705534 RepID=A0A7T0C2Y2_9BACT|nr:MAG: hypothetical protein G3M78_09350 [Candidatus Nitrohelix vancouverensis]
MKLGKFVFIGVSFALLFWGCNGGMVGTVQNPPYEHNKVLSQIKPASDSSKVYKDAKYGFSFRFPADWEIVEPVKVKKMRSSVEEGLPWRRLDAPFASWDRMGVGLRKVQLESDFEAGGLDFNLDLDFGLDFDIGITDLSNLRVLVKGPDAMIIARVDQMKKSLSRVSYESGGWDDFLDDVMISVIRESIHGIFSNKPGVVETKEIAGKSTVKFNSLNFEIANKNIQEQGAPLYSLGRHIIPFENDFLLSVIVVGSPEGNLKDDVIWKIYDSFQFKGLPSETA